MPKCTLAELLKEKIVVFDGAMGTSIQNRHLTAGDFGGHQYEGCNEHLVLTRPGVIGDIHRSFLDAGADVIETNTFGGTALVLTEYGLQDKAYDINKTAAQLARQAASEYSTANKPRLIAGSMGPTTKSLTVTGGTTYVALIENYYQQASALIDGGVNLLILETCQDTRNVKAAIQGINRARQEKNVNIPLAISGTIEPMGAMLAGQGVESLYASLEHTGMLSIGLNCATGPSFMTSHIRALSGIAGCYISCMPNAGLPNEEGLYEETPDSLVSVLKNFVKEGWVNILGGCCGTTPAHIAAIADLVDGKPPRTPQKTVRWHVSGIDYLEFTEDNRPLIVGERTNVIGSRKFKRLIAEGQIDEAAEIGRQQARNGAHVLDVCLANPDRNEYEDMETFLRELIRKIKTPLMIDSTDAAVVERALQFCQGKSIINSINLEDGEKRFQEVVPIAKNYGAALIVGCIDDDPVQSMGLTVERKLQIARRSYELLTGKYRYPAQNIIFDPLVFPCATGDENYIGSAGETIRAITAIKKAFPLTRTVLGISNVSFGLPPSGREVLNAAFLYHCTKAGLDLAIVNAQTLKRYASIPDEEKKLADDLLFNRGHDPIGAFAAFYKEKKVEEVIPKENRPLEERLAAYIVEATKDGLIGDLEEALKKYSPLEIINGPLMKGMDEVGRLFGANELIVAEVLQSAETMKAAVSHLEPLMEKSDVQLKGTFILATVKGDVHDIGKNLVDIIFSNNGYKVINLGIKVPSQEIINACKKYKPDAIGLSGLLVKSAQQMVLTAQDLCQAGIVVPMLVGGAALSNRFTRLKIAPAYQGLVLYAKDAMIGLDRANRLLNGEQRAALEKEIQADDERLTQLDESKKAAKPVQKDAPEIVIRRDNVIPAPPDLDRHVHTSYPLDEIYPYLNLQTLYGKHLGLRGTVVSLLKSGDEKALDLQRAVSDLQDEIRENGILIPRAVYQFFPIRADGDALIVLDPAGTGERARFVFPRQSQGARLCLTDFTDPVRPDNAAMFVTTCGGPELSEWTERYKREGQYLKSHTLQALAIECAEAFAELLHKQIRGMWGIADAPGLTVRDMLHAKYQGIRVSFGYPACPRLEDQTQLFDLLAPEESINVSLTDTFMMEPEASVSALVFHHPGARYFNIDERDLQAFETRLAG